MTKNQKIAAAAGVVFLVVAFVFIYQQFSQQDGAETDTTKTMTPPSIPVPPMPDLPPVGSTGEATPDGVADDILENDADALVLGDETNGEQQAAEESTKTIDDVANTYDDLQL